MINRSTRFWSALCQKALAKNNKQLLSYGASTLTKRTAIQFGTFLFAIVLTGCVTKTGQSPLETLAQVVIPEVKVTDFRYTECNAIWENDQPIAKENALYWLRMMDCADRMDTQQARADAKQIEVTNWSDAFEQNILLNSADPSIAERRKMLDSINTYSLSFPTTVRPLLQLWREQQVQIINLADAGARYKRLQQEMDTKLENLKDANAKLSFELRTTSRKLENLTDIERQLSSRKKISNETEKEVESQEQGDKPEASTEQKPTAPESSSEQNQTESGRDDKS